MGLCARGYVCMISYVCDHGLTVSERVFVQHGLVRLSICLK